MALQHRTTERIADLGLISTKLFKESLYLMLTAFVPWFWAVEPNPNSLWVPVLSFLSNCTLWLKRAVFLTAETLFLLWTELQHRTCNLKLTFSVLAVVTCAVPSIPLWHFPSPSSGLRAGWESQLVEPATSKRQEVCVSTVLLGNSPKH